MDNLTFGTTMTIVGMGGTLVTLWLLSIVMLILKKVFPIETAEQHPEGGEEKGSEK